MYSSCSNQTNINPGFLHLLKSGTLSLSSLKEYMKELQQPDYPMDFVAFMDQMIIKSGMDRKTIIARSGLSESLGYKYLSGQKKTTERDYILALCIALKLNFSQTQHALRCYGMPLLGSIDRRAFIIRRGIEQGLDRYKIDECLENAHFPMIKISNDMPSAEIKDSYFTLESRQNEPPTYQPAQYHDEDEFEVIDSSAKSTHCGNAPFDFSYFGSMTLRDTIGTTYHLRAEYLITGKTSFIVMNDEQYEHFKEEVDESESFDSGKHDFIYSVPEEVLQAHDGMLDALEELEEGNDSEKQDYLELYFSLLDATASTFFPFFIELDHLTDQKVAEVMAKIDDTRNYSCRIGCHCIGVNKPEMYIEMFNTAEPERREYYQMIENADHECIYTASHESYFMQIEMNDLYSLYFRNNKKQEFFIQATNTDIDNLDKRYRMIFNNLRHHLHAFAREQDGVVKISNKQFYEEESEFFAELFAASMQAGDIAQAKQALAEQESAIEACKISKSNKLLQLIILEHKKYNIAKSEGNQDEASQICDSIISRKQKALKLEAALGKYAPTVFTIIADMLLAKWRSHQKAGQNSKPVEELEKILELTKHGAFSNEEESSQQRFELYQAYAYHIDRTDPEAAEGYYKKAIKEATKHHLDQNPYSAAAVPVVYNNYAWMLWYILSNEEAIIYYGRAIELTETYLENGVLPPEQAKEKLSHYGAALIRIYEATSRQKEKERLIKRLQESGVSPEEQV